MKAKKVGLGSTAHLGQMGVAQMNAQDAARLGLGTLTHYYGSLRGDVREQRRATVARRHELQQ